MSEEAARIFADEFELRIASDDRIIAAYVANQAPWEFGDRYNDVNLVIACLRESFDEVSAALPQMIDSIQSLFEPQSPAFWPSSGKFITRGGLQIDVYLYKTDLGTWRRPVARILKSSPNFFCPALGDGKHDPYLKDRSASTAVGAAKRFWEVLPCVPRSLRNDEFAFAYDGILQLFVQLLRVLQERSPRLWRRKASNAWRIDEQDHAAILAAIGTSHATREDLLRQMWSLADLMSKQGREVCEAIGGNYPHELERVMRERVKRDVAATRIDEP